MNRVVVYRGALLHEGEGAQSSSGVDAAKREASCDTTYTHTHTHARKELLSRDPLAIQLFANYVE